jgi:hypothetical protein
VAVPRRLARRLADRDLVPVRHDVLSGVAAFAAPMNFSRSSFDGAAMIAKQYGTRVQSVVPNFDANAMNEVGFTRDNDWTMPAEEFFGAYEKSESHELTAAAEGDVQSEAEERLLKSLEQQLRAADSAAGADAVLLVENEQGHNYPKTRHTTENKVVGHENRFYFRFTIEPPLRVAVYRKR